MSLPLALAMLVCPALGQDSKKIPISFLPPPLETATYSLGIYDAKSGKLVRHLQEAATESAFTIGLNGLITNWDGKDDAGKAVPPGKYDARGYAVGELKVEGVETFGNDWIRDDETLRVNEVQAIALIPEDEGLAAVVHIGDKWEILRYAGTDGRLLWHKPVGIGLDVAHLRSIFPLCTLEVRGECLLVTSLRKQEWACHISDGEIAAMLSDQPRIVNVDDKFAQTSKGKDGCIWKIEDEDLIEYSPSGEALRHLHAKDEPPLCGVAASSTSDRLYLLEGGANHVYQRVRGLSWVEAKKENDKQVSTWETFFERVISVAKMPFYPIFRSESDREEPPIVEASLVENPLDPGKLQKVKLIAVKDEKGSYLASVDGLRLRQISERPSLFAVRLVQDKATGHIALYQFDPAACDEFSIEGMKNMMAFDAGEIDMTADGEKPHPEKAAEPPDL